MIFKELDRSTIGEDLMGNVVEENILRLQVTMEALIIVEIIQVVGCIEKNVIKEKFLGLNFFDFKQ